MKLRPPMFAAPVVGGRTEVRKRSRDDDKQDKFENT